MAGNGRGSRRGVFGWPSGGGCVEPLSRSPVVWPWFCTGCGWTVASSAGAGTASRFLRSLETGGGEPAGKEITGSASAETCPHGDDGWGEFAGRLILLLIAGSG